MKEIAGIVRGFKKQVSITVNPLIPKPKTVFQWIGMISLDRARGILRLFRRELRGLVDTRPLDVNWGWIQASIALGDTSIGKLLVEWGVQGGDLGSWRRIIRRHGYDTSYVFTGRSPGGQLPWDNIIVDQLTERVLVSEYYAWQRLLGRSP